MAIEREVSQPLAGFTIGVTAARRAEEFANLLTRRGAKVVHTPAIRVIPLEDDAGLALATASVLANPPQVVVATTAIGFRGWVEYAEAQGLRLVEALKPARLIVRGPKAKGAARASGLRESWSPASESSSEVLEHLVAEGVGGVRIAVQLHGTPTVWEPTVDLCGELSKAGADVVPVPVYRWMPPTSPEGLDAMVGQICAGELDAVTFTSAPAVASLLTRAQDTGRLEPMLAALRGPVLAACVGIVTAAPLTILDVPTSVPERSRLGDLARLLEAELPHRA